LSKSGGVGGRAEGEVRKSKKRAIIVKPTITTENQVDFTLGYVHVYGCGNPCVLLEDGVL
jgi:hypothetical protein